MNPPLPVTPPATAPHSLNGNSISRIMLTVIAALLPATVFSFWLYGLAGDFPLDRHHWRCLLGEAACLRLSAPEPALPRPGRRLGTADRMAAGDVATTLGAVVDRGARRIVRHDAGQRGIRWHWLQSVQSGHGSARLSVDFLSRADDGLDRPTLPITAATAPNFHDGLMILIHGIPKLDAVASASLLSYTKPSNRVASISSGSLTAAAAAPVASLIGARARRSG